MQHGTSTRRLTRFAIAAVAALAATASIAQEKFPTKPIHLIVPFQAGGAADVVARVVGDSVARRLQQSVIVENRPGATGATGSLAVARAAPDGYTILMAVMSSHAVAPATKKEPPFDPVKDFTPIVRIGESVQTLVLRNGFPASNLKEFLDYAKKNPGKVNYASSGIASFPWLGAKLVERAAGIEMVHVPFPGDGPAMNSILTGQVDMLFTPSAQTYVDGGLVKLLGVASAQRVSATPNWPTLDEAGLPGFTLVSWVGFMGPANMPANVVQILNRATNETLAEPETRTRLEQIGYSVAGGSPEEFKETVRKNIETIRALNIQLD